jgi:cytochrome P450
MIPDPELVKEVLSNKFGHFGKPRSTRIGKLLANGVVNHDGEKWAKHRRILNPAFHHEKIKVVVYFLSLSLDGFTFQIALCCLSDNTFSK